MKSFDLPSREKVAATLVELLTLGPVLVTTKVREVDRFSPAKCVDTCAVAVVRSAPTPT